MQPTQVIWGQLKPAFFHSDVRPTLPAGCSLVAPHGSSHLPIEQAAALIAEDAAAQASDGVGGGPVIGGVI